MLEVNFRRDDDPRTGTSDAEEERLDEKEHEVEIHFSRSREHV